MLAVAMLRHLGFDAAPALVNTSRRKAVSEFLPGHSCFDHLIVHVAYNNQDYFLDPTYTFQRGKLDDLDIPDYGFAFLVRPGQTALHPMKPRGQGLNRIRIEEAYDIRSLDGEAFLTVRTVATGGEANNLRRVFSEDSLSNIGKGYQEFYGQSHFGIEMTAALTIDDDEELNRFEITEHYRIPQLWETSDEGGGSKTAEIRACFLGNGLTYPEKQIRRHPLWMDHPKNVTQIIDVQFPKKWNTTESSKTIENAAFRYESKVTSREAGLRAEYRYTSLANEVEAKDFAVYQIDMERLADDLSIQIKHGGEAQGTGVQVAAEEQEPSDFSRLLVGIAAALGIFAGLGLAVWMYIHDPAPRTSDPRAPQGLGGWLVLPLISTIMAPFSLIVATSSYFTNLSQLGAILDDESGFGVWRQYYVAGTFSNTLMLMPSVMLVVLLVRKRTGFPIHFTVIIGIEIISQMLLYSLETRIVDLDPPADGGGAIRSFMQLMIWGSYMRHSGRVKATFIRRRKPELSPLCRVS